jgi:hypothetical protein
MRSLQDKWHPNWLVDTLLRLAFITVLAWAAVTVAIYLGATGEATLVFPYEPVPEGTAVPAPSKE